MADNANAHADSDQVSAEAAKPSSKGKLLAAGFVSFIIVVESVVAYLVFPMAQDTVAFESNRLGDAADAESEAQAGNEKTPMVEFQLAETFSVSAFQPASNTTLRIDFQLFGLVREKDHDELVSLHAQLEHRFREQVIVTIRSAEITDLSEPGLGLIKRKILEKTNRAYGKPLLQDIIIPEFSFVEQ